MRHRRRATNRGAAMSLGKSQNDSVAESLDYLRPGHNSALHLIFAMAVLRNPARVRKARGHRSAEHSVVEGEASGPAAPRASGFPAAWGQEAAPPALDQWADAELASFG